MKRLLTLLLPLFAVINLNAQTQLYGQIDIADLKLTSCDFEKGANALVLFDKTDVAATSDITTISRHRRVKILNEKGLNTADVSIEFYSKDHYERITELEAQTIYLDNGVVKTIPVDKSLIYKQINDKTPTLFEILSEKIVLKENIKAILLYQHIKSYRVE